jgi:hypothetical protein
MSPLAPHPLPRPHTRNPQHTTPTTATATPTPTSTPTTSASATPAQHTRVSFASAALALPAADALVPLPSLTTPCHQGVGLAVSPHLGLLVTSSIDTNTLSVWALPDASEPVLANAKAASAAGCVPAAVDHRVGLSLVCTLGGDKGPGAPQAALRFMFMPPGPVRGRTGWSGYLAFTPAVPSGAATVAADGSARPLLLVTDAGHGAVHLVDVVGRAHAGYLAAPGSIAGPRGVAACGAPSGLLTVAVGTWMSPDCEDHVVRLYSGRGGAWELVRVVGEGLGHLPEGGKLSMPRGLRLTRDGTSLCVSHLDRISLFRVRDGAFVQHLATGLHGPADVEEVQGGWLVACWRSNSVQSVPSGTGNSGGPGAGDAYASVQPVDPVVRSRPMLSSVNWPSALVAVPGLGLVVREWRARVLSVFVSGEAMAQARMSGPRVAWMVAVQRAALLHHRTCRLTKA